MSTIYKMSFNNVEEQAIECNITNEAGDLDVIPITGAEDAIRIVSQDNDEDKFTPIKAKKCVIKFLNSQSVNLRTFATGEDNSWQVEVKINGLRVFIGWLEQGDITEPFLYQSNEVVTLTAIDGLGYLKDIRLVGFSGEIVNNYTDNIRIIDYIARALYRTGFQLNINVMNNIREEDFDDTSDTDTYGNIYATLFLYPKTFEDGIGQSISCYEVLQRILGHDCFITQSKGEWWIIRVREYLQGQTRKVTVFDYLGVAQSFTTIDYEKAIGLKDVNNTPFAGTPDATAFFSLARTNWLLERPYKSTKLIYNYEYPLEILCNSALLRGDFIADLPDELDGDGNTLTVKSYTTDCWEYLRNIPTDTQDSVEYTKIRYFNGREKERYIHMEAAANDDFYYMLVDDKIPMGISDKFTIGCAIRYGSDLGGGSGHFILAQLWVRLYADDGTYWNLHAVSGTGSANPGAYWIQANGPADDWATNQRFVEFEGESEDIDFTEWQQISAESAPLPRSGDIEVLLINNQNASSQTKDFGSLSMDYNPYINGSYGVYTGQFYKSTRDGEYRRNIKEQVYISNAPRKLPKGALLTRQLIDDAFHYSNVGRFYEGLENTSPPATLYEYGELQERAFQNQHRNADEVYHATCQGLGEGETDSNGADDHQDIIHKYYNRDNNPSDNNIVFQLVTQDVDLRNCEWTGTLIENSHATIDPPDDPVTFQYESK
jgi:hypothetical protein